MSAYVYIMASRRNGTIYVGVTRSLESRVRAHREGLIPGFTQQYNVKLLVYYEMHEDIREAIKREKVLKKRRRAAKVTLIEIEKPSWRDLYSDLIA